MPKTRRELFVAVAAVSLAGIAWPGHAADVPLTIVAGEDSRGEVMVGMSVEIYADEAGTIQHFLGDRYFAGGRDGALGTFTVHQVTPPDCGNTSLTLTPELPSGFFVAYSGPVEFAVLHQAPALRQAVAKGVENDIRAGRGAGEVVPYSIWRFELGAASPLVFAAIRTPNYHDESWGRPDGFNAIALLQQSGETLSVLDIKLWLASELDLSMDIDVMAVAGNPVTGGADLYVRYRSHEYNEYVGYDISDGKLRPMLHSECSM